MTTSGSVPRLALAAAVLAAGLATAGLAGVAGPAGTPTSTPAASTPAASTPSGAPAAPGASGTSAGNPLVGRHLYVDPDNPAARHLTAVPSASGAIGVIARTPQARWFTEDTPTDAVADAVRSYVTAAAATDAVPVLVVYAVPHRDCGGYSAGGFATAREYEAWIGRFAAGLDGRPAVVVVEPDALTAADCLTDAARAERARLITTAVERLGTDPAATVYIDGGHSRWLSPEVLADRLRLVGVSRARGFSLNVSNFYATDELIAYGEKVSRLLGGARYVVDTSRNGLGPAPDGTLNWCNPPGRALGAAPTAVTAGRHADAYLWIKNPGASDGTCDRGDPASGAWFHEYAVGLVERSRSVAVR